jgi:hypothetical protein
MGGGTYFLLHVTNINWCGYGLVAFSKSFNTRANVPTLGTNNQGTLLFKLLVVLAQGGTFIFNVLKSKQLQFNFCPIIWEYSPLKMCLKCTSTQYVSFVQSLLQDS